MIEKQQKKNNKSYMDSIFQSNMLNYDIVLHCGTTTVSDDTIPTIKFKYSGLSTNIDLIYESRTWKEQFQLPSKFGGVTQPSNTRYKIINFTQIYSMWNMFLGIHPMVLILENVNSETKIPTKVILEHNGTKYESLYSGNVPNSKYLSYVFPLIYIDSNNKEVIIEKVKYATNLKSEMDKGGDVGLKMYLDGFVDLSSWKIFNLNESLKFTIIPQKYDIIDASNVRRYGVGINTTSQTPLDKYLASMPSVPDTSDDTIKIISSHKDAYSIVHFNTSIDEEKMYWFGFRVYNIQTVNDFTYTNGEISLKGKSKYKIDNIDGGLIDDGDNSVKKIPGYIGKTTKDNYSLNKQIVDYLFSKIGQNVTVEIYDINKT